MLRLVTSIFLAILFNSCDKDKDDCNLPSFSGIYWTDVNGHQMSDADPDDWTLDDQWNDTEKDLFDTELETNCMPTFDYWISAYPNPVPDYANSVVGLAMGKDSVTSLEFRIVDRQCNVILTRDNELSHNIHFDLSGYAGETLRLYYKFIKDGCEFRGHGDIKIE